MHNLISGLQMSWWMFFDTFWALVFGFTLSGVVQAFISKKQMQRALGDHSIRSISKASFFGMVSSSCSYAATALGKTLFFRGADFTSAMVFAFASTNLVIELGLVLWILMGWQFAAAEFIGGAFMILLLWLVIPQVISKDLLLKIKSKSEDEGIASPEQTVYSDSDTKAKLAHAAGYTIGDFTMMRYELVIGFLVAGIATAIIPTSLWQRLFFAGHGVIATIENVIIAPFIAFISFVCSVGNVPMAAALWNNGISFGGTISFIFADLIALPLVLIYRKYYGTKIALRLTLTFWFVMSLSGLITQGIFSLLKISPKIHELTMIKSHVGVNATTFLNFVGLLVLGAVLYFGRNSATNIDSEFAKDLVCGMQVRKADAAATYELRGKKYYFCMEGCRDSFAKAPANYLGN